MQKEDWALPRLFLSLACMGNTSPRGDRLGGQMERQKSPRKLMQLCYLDWSDATAVRGIAGSPCCREENKHHDCLFGGVALPL